MQTGSLAAVASAVLLAGVTVDRAASTPTAQATSQRPGDAVERATGGASRSDQRTDVPQDAIEATAVSPAEARALATDAIARASEIVSTEARTTPELREEVVAASTVLVELLRRAEAGEGLTAPTLGTGDGLPLAPTLNNAPDNDGAPPEQVVQGPAAALTASDAIASDATAPDATAPDATTPDDGASDGSAADVDEAEGGASDDVALNDAVNTAIAEAAARLGLDPADDATTPQAVAHALEQMVADLDAVLAQAAPATVAVEPAPLTPDRVLAAQIEEGRADAERLAPMALLTAGYQNGRLSDNVLQELSWASGQRLRPDAAAQLERLNIAFRAQFGYDLQITSAYRSFEGQVRVRQTHGQMAATPGTSNHGWGVAVDLGSGVQRFGTAEHRWMRANAPEFGWILPDWAQENGSLPEPWHWEFEGVPDEPTS